ncbi:TPA: DUF1642 domain-containing protein [Streptococcus suis]
MNKQEAIEELMSKSREIIFGDDENVYLSRKRTIELVSKIHEPQKVVVPRCIDDYIKECRDGNVTLTQALFCLEYHKQEIGQWLNRNDETFARAWLDGYEVEQEKLYTVEIPDPNSYCDYRYLSRNDNGICLDASNDTEWKQKKRNQFTESEIKQDFEWAWNAGFAKEVE